MRQLTKNNRGQVGNIPGIVMTIVLIGAFLGAGFLILQEFRDHVEDTTSEGKNSSAYAGVNETINALQTVPELLGLIVLVIVIGIIIAVLMGVFPGARTSAT